MSSTLKIADHIDPTDFMAWPNPLDPDEVEWKLRYSTPTKSELMHASSVLAAYRALIFLPSRTREKRISAIRKALKSATDHEGGKASE